MGNTKSNYPCGELSRLDGDGFTGRTLNSLMEISSDHIPETVAELRERIGEYFKFCGTHDMRPGVEGLAYCLHVSRKTFWQWCNGQGRASSDLEWKDTCINARQAIGAFLEAASLAGRLNPATSIFLLKNWLGYQDTLTLDNSATEETEEQSAATLPTFTEFGLLNNKDTTEV